MKLYWAAVLQILALFCSLSLAAGAAPRCVEIFAADSFHPQWQRWISLEPGRTPDPIYAANARAALEQIFIPWFSGKSQKTYIEMLREMHRVSALGPVGSSPQNYRTSMYDTAIVSAGETRFDIYQKKLAENPERKNPENIGRNVDVPMELMDFNRFTALSEAVSQFDGKKLVLKKGPHVYEIPVVAEFVGDDLQIQWSNQLEGVASQRGAENKVLFKKTAKPRIERHQMPLPSEVASYLERANFLMTRLKTADLPRTEFINSLAEYYQLMICTHPFIRVNQSLIMNQVNYLLKQKNEPVLYHGLIDYWALVLPQGEFQKFFRNELQLQRDGSFSLY